jgi:hypothetical protein
VDKFVAGLIQLTLHVVNHGKKVMQFHRQIFSRSFKVGCGGKVVNFRQFRKLISVKKFGYLFIYLATMKFKDLTAVGLIFLLALVSLTDSSDIKLIKFQVCSSSSAKIFVMNFCEVYSPMHFSFSMNFKQPKKEIFVNFQFLVSRIFLTFLDFSFIHRSSESKSQSSSKFLRCRALIGEV